MTTDPLIRRVNTRNRREYATPDGDLVIAQRSETGWLVTAFANDSALTQVRGAVVFNEAGFGGRQWESQIDGQQHPSLLSAMREALAMARQQADFIAFMERDARRRLTGGAS